MTSPAEIAKQLREPQRHWLVELAQHNANDDNAWSVRGSGPIQTCDSLVARGLANHVRIFAPGRAYWLTDLGREVAQELGEPETHERNPIP
jgi:hypothetical protein